MSRSASWFLVASALAWASAPPAAAQASGSPYRTEPVTYRNPNDNMVLSATLALPAGQGPFSGLVLLTTAGADALVDRLVGLGYAVLLPERRGMLSVERMLQASLQDMATDASSAALYLAQRPDVRGTIGLIGQSYDSPAALLAAGTAVQIPLVLLGLPGLHGAEMFKLEQRGLAEGRAVSPEDLLALDAYVDRITAAALSAESSTMRGYQLSQIVGQADVELPRSAEFPNTPDGQVHFFSSAWWKDRLAFRPDEAILELNAPVLILLGHEDPFRPLDLLVPPIERSLEDALTEDATLCVMTGRTRQSFTPVVVDVIVEWLAARMPPAGGEEELPDAPAPEPCVKDWESLLAR